MLMQLKAIWNYLFAALVVGVLLSSCSQTPVEHCQTPRPEICTEQFAPVCATRQDGTTQSYPNACYACRDKAVVSHVNGQCT